MIIKLHQWIDSGTSSSPRVVGRSFIWINSDHIVSFNEILESKNTQIFLSSGLRYIIVKERAEDIAKMLNGNNNA